MKRTILVIIFILVIISLIYLYNSYREEKKIIESFSFPLITQTTQTSLNAYYKPTINSDSLQNNKYAFNSVRNVIKNKNNDLNGYWQSEKFYGSFMQNNDLLVLTFNTTKLNKNYSNYTVTQEEEGETCPLNQFIGICQLNIHRDNFYLRKVLCNTLGSTSLELINTSPYKLSGLLTDQNTITIYSAGKSPIIFTKAGNYSYDNNVSNYINHSSFVTPIPSFNSSTFSVDNICPEGYLIATSQNITGINTPLCVKEDKVNNRVCNDDTTCDDINCSFSTTDYSNCNINGTNKKLAQCNTNLTVTTTSSEFATLPIYNNICSSLKSLSIGTGNVDSSIICYIKNIGDIQVLSYQFSGVGKEDSCLTTENNYYVHTYVKNFIKKNITKLRNIPISDYMAFNNIYYSNDSLNSTFLSDSITSAKKYYTSNHNNINKGVPRTNKLPQCWEINQSYSTSACYFKLKTKSSKISYDVEKYPKFNNDGSTMMSLNDDGVNNELIFEDYHQLLHNTNKNIYIGTANIRCNNLLYLSVGNGDNNALNNSKVVQLTSKPAIDGKWMIITFNSKNINQLFT
jgi:hypothetical protein